MDIEMKNVKIYSPSKNVMQSGFANSTGWILEYSADNTANIEPVMGWTSSDNVLKQVKLKFPSSEAAIAFAKKHGWKYILFPKYVKNIKPKNYSDNFKYKEL